MQTAENDERYALHLKFFNEEIVAVKDLDDFQLKERLDELISIDFEVKSRVNAINSEVRARRAKKSEAQRSWMVTPNDSQITSDAIANVRERKKRMSKGDKMYADLVNTLGKEEADRIMSGVARHTSGGSKTSSHTTDVVDKRVPEKSNVINHNTQNNLLEEINNSVVKNIQDKSMPLGAVFNSAVTAAHIARNIIGRPEKIIPTSHECESTAFDTIDAKLNNSNRNTKDDDDFLANLLG